jgi:carboxyl-terminal processing protease
VRHAASPRLLVALMMALVIGLSLVPPATKPAHAADATIIFGAYQEIITHHIERQDPARLLNGALLGLRQALATAGVMAELPELTAADQALVKLQFQARFDQAVRLGRAKLTVMQLQYAAAKAMAARLDDGWTSFLTPVEWNKSQGKGWSGLGIWPRSNRGGFWIADVFPYTPAEAAGLHPFDRVLAIDGQSVQGITNNEFNNRTEGPDGTTVKLTIRRPGRAAPLTISIVRQHIATGSGATHKRLNDGFGYIWFRGGAGNPPAEFRRALAELQRNGMRGLILDLRLKSRGASPGMALFLGNALLPAGVPIQTIVSHARGTGPGIQTETCPLVINGHSRDISTWYEPMPSPCRDVTSGGTLLDPSIPLAVLIDETSHHMSETLAAAIRDAGRGKLVGVRTAGRMGLGPDVALPGGTGITVKSYIMLAGNGARLDKVGVQPDVVIELTAQDLDRGVDTPLQRAVQILSR